MNKEVLEKVIKSKTIRQWVEDTKHEFSESEQISLVFNSDLTLDEKGTILEDISSDFSKESKDEIDKILANISWVQLAYSGFYISYALLFTVEDEYSIENRCIKTLDKFIEMLNDKSLSKNNKYENRLEIIDLNTSKTVAYITLNDKNEVIDYALSNESQLVKSEIQNSYVDIDYKFDRGDIVSIVGSDERYVVCYINDISEELKKDCDWFDSSVAVIPESVLDSDKDYKEQIEEILKNRLERINSDGDYADLDIISKYHEHINITLIEKVDK